MREARFENFIVHLELERIPVPTTPQLTAARRADGGRARVFGDEPAGVTQLLVLDLPCLPGETAGTPRLWVAGAGAGAGWRRAGVMVGMDGGAGFVALGTLEGGTVIGTATTVLGVGSCAGWDRFASVEVELLRDTDWLEGMTAEAVLGGGNLALVGGELIQFMVAEAIAPRRFRLHGLLRGRRGTETAAAHHHIGESFVLIDTARMLALDMPLEMLGHSGKVKPCGDGDVEAEASTFVVEGTALRPLSPVHLRAGWNGGDLVVDWVRRSRMGFAWTDFVEAPLAETRESYAVEVRLDGHMVRREITAEPHFRYSPAQFAVDGGGDTIEIGVAQLSAEIGPGAAAAITINPQFGEAS